MDAVDSSLSMIADLLSSACWDTRNPTPAEASENWEAQRRVARAAMRAQALSNQRSSRELHVRQSSTSTG
jgi:hypothetical protein